MSDFDMNGMDVLRSINKTLLEILRELKRQGRPKKLCLDCHMPMDDERYDICSKCDTQEPSGNALS